VKSKQYVYPAQFVNEDNGTISVYFPDLDGCHTYDDTIEGASLMAKDALEGYIEFTLEMGKELPKPSNIKEITVDDGFVMMVAADVLNMPEENKVDKIEASLMAMEVVAE
jgi:predicted RNase H-like HicB family nuclease